MTETVMPLVQGARRPIGATKKRFAKLLLSAICFPSSTLVLAPSPWLRTCNDILQESVHGAYEQDNSAPAYG